MQVRKTPRKPLAPTLLAVFIIVLIDLLGMAMIIPLLPFYSQTFGATALQIGFLASCFALSQMIFGPVLGALSDRYGRKLVLLVSQLVGFVGLVLFGQARTLTMLFIARSLSGAAASNLAVAQAYVADNSKPEDRARSFAMIGVAFGIGLFLGPALSGLLVKYDMRLPIHIASALALAGFIATLILLPKNQTKNQTSDLKKKSANGITAAFPLFKKKPLQKPLWQFFVFVFAFAYFAQGIGLFLERKFQIIGRGFGPTELGYLFAFCGILGIIFQGWLVGKLVPKFGEDRLVKTAFSFDMAGYGLLAFATSTPMLIASASLFSFGNSNLRPCLMSLISRECSSEEQGQAMGLTTSLQSLSQIVAPVIGGALIDKGALGAWVALLVAICVLSFAPAFKGKMKNRRLNMHGL